MDIEVGTQEDLMTKYKRLVEKRDSLLSNKMKIEAELNARKRSLKDALEACKADGFNPDTLTEDIKRLKEVLYVKLEMFEADLKSAEEQMAPILREIE